MTLAVSKVCTRCQVAKMLSEFPPNDRRSDGRQSWCLNCCALYRRAKRAADPERRALDRAQVDAYNEALRELREAHAVEFQRLYTAAKRRRGI